MKGDKGGCGGEVTKKATATGGSWCVRGKKHGCKKCKGVKHAQGLGELLFLHVVWGGGRCW